LRRNDGAKCDKYLVLVDGDVSEVVPRIVEERNSWKVLKILLEGARYALLIGANTLVRSTI